MYLFICLYLFPHNVLYFEHPGTDLADHRQYQLDTFLEPSVDQLAGEEISRLIVEAIEKLPRIDRKEVFKDMNEAREDERELEIEFRADELKALEEQGLSNTTEKMLLYESAELIRLEEKKEKEEAEKKYFNSIVDHIEEPLLEEMFVEAIDSLDTHGWSEEKDKVLRDFITRLRESDMLFEKLYRDAI